MTQLVKSDADLRKAATTAAAAHEAAVYKQVCVWGGMQTLKNGCGAHLQTGLEAVQADAGSMNVAGADHKQVRGLVTNKSAADFKEVRGPFTKRCGGP